MGWHWERERESLVYMGVRTSYKWPSGHSNLSPSLIGVTQGAWQILSLMASERATSLAQSTPTTTTMTTLDIVPERCLAHTIKYGDSRRTERAIIRPISPLHLLRAARFESDLRNRHCTWCAALCVDSKVRWWAAHLSAKEGCALGAA